MIRNVLVVIAALVLYLVVAPTSILGGDNAEFSIGCVPHPSRYPLYVL